MFLKDFFHVHAEITSLIAMQTHVLRSMQTRQNQYDIFNKKKTNIKFHAANACTRVYYCFVRLYLHNVLVCDT